MYRSHLLSAYWLFSFHGMIRRRFIVLFLLNLFLDVYFFSLHDNWHLRYHLDLLWFDRFLFNIHWLDFSFSLLWLDWLLLDWLWFNYSFHFLSQLLLPHFSLKSQFFFLFRTVLFCNEFLLSSKLLLVLCLDFLFECVVVDHLKFVVVEWSVLGTSELRDWILVSNQLLFWFIYVFIEYVIRLLWWFHVARVELSCNSLWAASTNALHLIQLLDRIFFERKDFHIDWPSHWAMCLNPFSFNLFRRFCSLFWLFLDLLRCPDFFFGLFLDPFRWLDFSHFRPLNLLIDHSDLHFNYGSLLHRTCSRVVCRQCWLLIRWSLDCLCFDFYGSVESRRILFNLFSAVFLQIPFLSAILWFRWGYFKEHHLVLLLVFVAIIHAVAEKTVKKPLTCLFWPNIRIKFFFTHLYILILSLLFRLDLHMHVYIVFVFAFCLAHFRLRWMFDWLRVEISAIVALLFWFSIDSFSSSLLVEFEFAVGVSLWLVLSHWHLYFKIRKWFFILLLLFFVRVFVVISIGIWIISVLLRWMLLWRSFLWRRWVLGISALSRLKILFLVSQGIANRSLSPKGWMLWTRTLIGWNCSTESWLLLLWWRHSLLLLNWRYSLRDNWLFLHLAYHELLLDCLGERGRSLLLFSWDFLNV